MVVCLPKDKMSIPHGIFDLDFQTAKNEPWHQRFGQQSYPLRDVSDAITNADKIASARPRYPTAAYSEFDKSKGYSPDPQNLGIKILPDRVPPPEPRQSAVGKIASTLTGLTGGLGSSNLAGSLALGVPQALGSLILGEQRLSFDKQKWSTLQQQSKDMGFMSPAQMFNTPSFGKQTTNKPVFASAAGLMDNDTLGAGQI
jgi:hypothetical protein